jgi:hypothetical protein
MCETSLQPFRMCMQWWRKKANQGAVKYQRERLASGRSDARAYCPPVSNNYTLRTLMNAALCSTSPRATCLLPAHGCSLMLRACCPPIDVASCSVPAATPMDIALCSTPAPRPLRFSHARGDRYPEGTTFPCAPLSRLFMEHLQHKAFVATYVRNRLNIYNIRLQHMCMGTTTYATYV